MTDSEYDTLSFGNNKNAGVDKTECPQPESNDPPAVYRQDDALGDTKTDILRNPSAVFHCQTRQTTRTITSQSMNSPGLIPSTPSLESSRFHSNIRHRKVRKTRFSEIEI